MMRIGSFILLIACSLLGQERVGTAFSYQGRLLVEGAPAQGPFDLWFGLFPSAAGGELAASPITHTSVPVSEGVFMCQLDFGTNVFSGAECWLEIKVRGVTGAFVTLSPRQLLTPVPYALYTLKAEGLTGPVLDSQLPPNVARLDVDQTFSGTVRFGREVAVEGSLEAGSFTGDGQGLSNVVATMLSAEVVQRFWQVSIPFVAITNAGNPPDSNGKGGVDYDFRIGKYEINNNQYVTFLNSIAADDAHATYSTNMALTLPGGIERSGSAGEYAYAVKPGMGHRPVVWVEYHDALRFCNWLHNGQPNGAQTVTTTEDGAYTLTQESILANTVVRNANARFWLPSDDEWFKAAYHQPPNAGGDPSGYWTYPIQSNDVPFSEPPPGFLNSANTCCETGEMATDLGAYIYSPSYYGTYDQGGNVQEWTEEIIFVLNRRLRGGSWIYNEFYLASHSFEFDTPDYDAEAIGFRVAGRAK